MGGEGACRRVPCFQPHLTRVCNHGRPDTHTSPCILLVALQAHDHLSAQAPANPTTISSRTCIAPGMRYVRETFPRKITRQASNIRQTSDEGRAAVAVSAFASRRSRPVTKCWNLATIILLNPQPCLSTCFAPRASLPPLATFRIWSPRLGLPTFPKRASTSLPKPVVSTVHQ